MQFFKDNYYRLRLWWLEYGNVINYNFFNFIDPPPKIKRKEKVKDWLDRIETKYALRISRYYFEDYNFSLGRLMYMGLSIEEKSEEEKKKWKHYHDLIKERTVIWEQYLREAERRRFEDKHLRN